MKKSKMYLKDLFAGMTRVAYTNGCRPDMEVTGIAYDSRKVKKGDVFVAISGYATDGNRFIRQAIEAGAAAVVTDQLALEGVPSIVTRSARYALAIMSKNWFDSPAEKLITIGVTGTNGKTSVTMLLKSVLEEVTGKKVGLIGTIQNMIGDQVLPSERTTPESFELQQLLATMVEQGCGYAVMEVSSHALELERAGGIQFDAGAFTNLTEDHLDFHKTMERYAAAKARHFRNCRCGVFNGDDPYCPEMLDEASGTKLIFSTQDPGARLYAKSISLEADHVSFDLVCEGNTYPVWVGIPGTFTAYNALTVLGLAYALGLPMDKAAAALKNAKGVKGRVEVVPTPGTDFTVLIDYAHTPDGLENVLRSVKGFCKGRTVAVFGCGGDRDKSKRPIMGKIGVTEADAVIFTSDNPRTEDPNEILTQILEGAQGSETPYVVIENRRAAIEYALDHGQKDDIIVLAGKGHETYQEINGVKYHLDEREEVAGWCARREGKKGQI